MIKKEYQPKFPDGTPAGPVQVFEAETETELIDKLANAHEHASLKIAQLRKEVRPDPEKAEDWKPKSWTADEQFLIAEEMKDPAKVIPAIRKIVDEEFGLSKRLSTTESKTAKQLAIEETNAFVERHPEFYRCPQNQTAMEAWMAEKKAAWNLRNLEIAYEDLSANNKLAVKSEPQTIRPRGSTGLRRENSSAPPVDKKNSQEALRQEVEREIKNGTYRQRIATDAGFRAKVDALGR